ncbi:MAG: SDR family oxidoreductase [Bacteroidota bacterium]
MKTCLVTGGNGFIGSNIALALLNAGCGVRVLHRHNSDLRALEGATVEHCIGDVRDPDSLRRAIKGCDTVFHTAAIVSYWRKERELMYDVNIRGTRNVVEACLDLGVEKLVHTSSIAALGPAENGEPIDEAAPFNWDRFDVGYRISKNKAELEVLRGVRQGLQAVIVNPSVVIGPRDVQFHGGQLIRDVRKRRIFYYPDGGINIVYVDDVVRGQLAAAQRGRIGERYILCGENLTHRQALTTIADVVGGLRPFFKLPSLLAKRIAGTAEGVANMTGFRPWVTRELIAGIGLNSWFTCRKAERELGYAMTPFRDAVEMTFRWYREKHLLN